MFDPNHSELKLTQTVFLRKIDLDNKSKKNVVVFGHFWDTLFNYSPWVNRDGIRGGNEAKMKTFNLSSSCFCLGWYTLGQNSTFCIFCAIFEIQIWIFSVKIQIFYILKTEYFSAKIQIKVLATFHQNRIFWTKIGLLSQCVVVIIIFWLQNSLLLIS